MAFTRKTEVRHISQTELIKIAEILSQPSTSPAWKKLMQIVPSELTHHEQLSDCRPKYNSMNIRSIETAGAKLNNASQIFLEEWITSGRIRPTLSHLLQLFVKSELFRAADYVAINLLSEAPPQRPRRGPAAKIDISLPHDDDIVHNVQNLNSASKNIASKQMYNESLLSNHPTSEEDSVRVAGPLSNSQNVRPTPQPTQTTNGFTHSPETCASRIQVSHENVPPLPQQTSNNGTSHSPIESTHSLSTTHRSPEHQISNMQLGSPPEAPHNFIPNFGLLHIRSNASNNSNSQPDLEALPNLSILNAEEGSNKSNASASPIEVSSTYRSADQTSSAQFYPPPGSSHNFVPNLSLIGMRFNASGNQNLQPDYDNIIPNLSFLNGTEQRDSVDEIVPHLSQLLDQTQSTSSVSLATSENQTDPQESSAEMLPCLSQLMN